MNRIKAQLSQASAFWFALYATAAAFMTYFSMYAFRKPFTATSYESITDWQYSLDFKTAIVLAQILGYAISKFIGIKVISEMTAGKRAFAIVFLVALSEVALILFALVPSEFKLLALFLNGLPLGMIWGLVFSFLEGRRLSEILGAGLSVSFIVASGVVKSVGQWLMIEFNVPEIWMPAFVGMLFLLPLMISVYFLSLLPAPNLQDIAERHERKPMSAADRKQFFFRYAPGLVALILTYILLTGIRDFSDNFAAELWAALGYGDQPGIFSESAIYTTLIILLLLSLIMLVKDNFRAFMTNHLFIFVGVSVIGVSTLLYEFNLISPLAWMIIHATGIYLAYIPFNCLLFDRMLSVVNDKANAGFLIYLADAMGYAGSVGILLYKNLFEVNLSWLNFMIQSSYMVSLFGGVCILFSAWYFYQTLYAKHAEAKKALAT